MTIKESITVDDALEVLNRMLETDPQATREIFLFGRVPCNKALADDPTIQVKTYQVKKGEPKLSVGVLGVLNGLFGIDEGGWGPISVNVELVCSKGCEIPEGIPRQIGGQCPVCVEASKAAASDVDEAPAKVKVDIGLIDFGPLNKFTRTEPPEKRREGSP